MKKCVLSVSSYDDSWVRCPNRGNNQAKNNRLSCQCGVCGRGKTEDVYTMMLGAVDGFGIERGGLRSGTIQIP